MASQKLFDEAPPFPDEVPVADMTTVSLASLNKADAATSKHVLQSCQELGFFLLDLRGDALGDELIGEIDELFGAMQRIMNVPADVKKTFLHDYPRSFLGFKPRGVAKTETGEPDRFEWFNLGQDGLLGNEAAQKVPDVVQSHNALFLSFLHHCQTIVSTINRTLALQLNLPAETFTSLQPLDKPSGTVIRMIKADPTPASETPRTAMVGHSDFGSITLLANVIGGLQILTPGHDATELDRDGSAWKWVRPRPGCLIVNLGDAMVDWTGGLLRSNVHRVRYAPGEQRYVERYSLALLVRPEKEARMEKLVPGNIGEEGAGMEGEGDGKGQKEEPLKAWEWEVKKAVALAKGEKVQSKGGIRVAF